MNKPNKSFQKNPELRWERLIRYQVIEIFAQWEGRLTTKHLCDRFEIGRQQASRDIQRYLKEIAPGNLEYDASLKGYRPSVDFSPVVTQGEPGEYLSLLHEHPTLVSTNLYDSPPTPTEILKPPLRNISPNIIRPLIIACREQMRVEVEYQSLSNPTTEQRVISPHTIVYNGVRWHARAYCEKNRAFRDFVLSRFIGEPDVFDTAEVSAEDDEAWQTFITAIIEPDPRLTKAQKQVIELDYGMLDGRLCLTDRAALLQYRLRQMQLDSNVLRGRASAQQIIIANYDELADWLF